MCLIERMEVGGEEGRGGLGEGGKNSHSGNLMLGFCLTLSSHSCAVYRRLTDRVEGRKEE